MIGQEGTMEQLKRYTVNNPAPTMAQIRTSTEPITDTIKTAFNKIKDKVTNVIDEIKSGTITILTIVIIGGILYLISTNNK